MPVPPVPPPITGTYKTKNFPFPFHFHQNSIPLSQTVRALAEAAPKKMVKAIRVHELGGPEVLK